MTSRKHARAPPKFTKLDSVKLFYYRMRLRISDAFQSSKSKSSSEEDFDQYCSDTDSYLNNTDDNDDVEDTAESESESPNEHVYKERPGAYNTKRNYRKKSAATCRKRKSSRTRSAHASTSSYHGRETVISDKLRWETRIGDQRYDSSSDCDDTDENKTIRRMKNDNVNVESGEILPENSTVSFREHITPVYPTPTYCSSPVTPNYNRTSQNSQFDQNKRNTRNTASIIRLQTPEIKITNKQSSPQPKFKKTEEKVKLAMVSKPIKNDSPPEAKKYSSILSRMHPRGQPRQRPVTEPKTLNSSFGFKLITHNKVVRKNTWKGELKKLLGAVGTNTLADNTKKSEQTNSNPEINENTQDENIHHDRIPFTSIGQQQVYNTQNIDFSQSRAQFYPTTGSSYVPGSFVSSFTPTTPFTRQFQHLI